MLYYDTKIKYELNNIDDEKNLINEIRAMNRHSRRNSTNERKLMIYDRNDGIMNAVLMIDCSAVSLTQAKKSFEEEYGKKNKQLFKSFRFITTSPKEITVEAACELIDVGCMDNYFDGFTEGSRLCEADYIDEGYIDCEELILDNKNTTYSETVDDAHRFLADNSFFEELERIYSPLNKHKFYGVPVHYKINAASRETAKHLVELLAQALYSNQRLKSSRVTYVTETNPDFRRSDFDDLCKNSYASLVAVECSDDDGESSNYARESQRKCENIEENIKLILIFN